MVSGHDEAWRPPRLRDLTKAREAGDAVRVRLADGREVRLRLRPEDREHHYRGARRAWDSERAERQVLAALVAGEGGPVGPYRKTEKNHAIYRQGAHLRVGMQEAREAGADDEEAVERTVEADPNVLKNADMNALQAAERMSFVEEVLRQYHPDFDGKNRGERIALLIGAARHIDEAWWALDAFEEFVQVGSSGGRPRTKAADPQQNVRAAELRDALGLTYPEIGKVLGVSRSDSDRRRYAHKPAEEMVGRGRRLLIENLGEEEHGKYIESIRPGLRRWYALDPRGRTLERMIALTPRLTGRTPEEVEGVRPGFERMVDERLPEDGEPPA